MASAGGQSSSRIHNDPLRRQTHYEVSGKTADDEH